MIARYMCGVDNCLATPTIVIFATFSCGIVDGLASCFQHQLKAHRDVMDAPHEECGRVVIEVDFKSYLAEHPELSPPYLD